MAVHANAEMFTIYGLLVNEGGNYKLYYVIPLPADYKPQPAQFIGPLSNGLSGVQYQICVVSDPGSPEKYHTGVISLQGIQPNDLIVVKLMECWKEGVERNGFEIRNHNAIPVLAGNGNLILSNYPYLASVKRNNNTDAQLKVLVHIPEGASDAHNSTTPSITNSNDYEGQIELTPLGQAAGMLDGWISPSLANLRVVANPTDQQTHEIAVNNNGKQTTATKIPIRKRIVHPTVWNI